MNLLLHIGYKHSPKSLNEIASAIMFLPVA